MWLDGTRVLNAFNALDGCNFGLDQKFFSGMQLVVVFMLLWVQVDVMMRHRFHHRISVLLLLYRR
jgi:hypothetical protein